MSKDKTSNHPNWPHPGHVITSDKAERTEWSGDELVIPPAVMGETLTLGMWDELRDKYDLGMLGYYEATEVEVEKLNNCANWLSSYVLSHKKLSQETKDTINKIADYLDKAAEAPISVWISL